MWVGRIEEAKIAISTPKKKSINKRGHPLAAELREELTPEIKNLIIDIAIGHFRSFSLANEVAITLRSGGVF